MEPKEDKLLLDCLKKCEAACQKAIDKCENISDMLKASLLVCVTACKTAIENPSTGSCAVACEEADEVTAIAKYNSDKTGIEVLDASVACAALYEVAQQKSWGLRSKHANRICRFISVDKGSINREAKTLPISFSSEQPALQRAKGLSEKVMADAGLKDGDTYIEVLDHSKGNVDLSVLSNRGAFLDEHQETRQIGVVEQVEIGDDRIGRAIVRCGTDELSATRFSQMADGIRTHISVGYSYTKFLGDDTLPDGNKAKRFAFTPHEISSVAIPADGTIGVARSYADLTKQITPFDSTHSVEIQETKIMPEVDTIKAREDAIVQERNRIAELTKIADGLIKDHSTRNNGEMTNRIRSLTNEAVISGLSIGDYQIRVLKEVLGAKEAKPVMLKDCTDKPEEYSLRRAIQTALLNRTDNKHSVGLPDGRELEVHQEMVRKAKEAGDTLEKSGGGFFVPYDTNMPVRSNGALRITRDSQATIFAQGGAFVPSVLQLPIIEILRNQEVLSRLGVRQMAGLQGNIFIPRQESTATAYSVSEIGLLTSSQQLLSQIAMSPHRVGSTQLYSRQFVMQSAPDAEAFIRDDHMQVLALKHDALGLFGQGAQDEPLGVMNTPGIGSIVFGATPTYKQLVSMRTLIRAANVLGNLALVSTPETEGSLSTVAEALTGATTIGGAQNAIWKPGLGSDQIEGRVLNNVPAIASKQMPNNQVLLGVFDQMIKAMWGGMEVIVDIYTKAKNAEVEITFNTWLDYAVRHPQAFVLSADAGNQ
jgi:HK97 family phage major capsid protein